MKLKSLIIGAILAASITGSAMAMPTNASNAISFTVTTDSSITAANPVKIVYYGDVTSYGELFAIMGGMRTVDFSHPFNKTNALAETFGEDAQAHVSDISLFVDLVVNGRDLQLPNCTLHASSGSKAPIQYGVHRTFRISKTANGYRCRVY